MKDLSDNYSKSSFRYVLAGFCLSIFAALIAHIASGSVDLAARDVMSVIAGQSIDPVQKQIVLGLRLPRAIVALLSGAMLGSAGALLQIVTRNPLAEPGLLGVSGGAVLAIVAAIVWGLADETGLSLGVFGVFGGLTTAALVYFLSLNGSSDPIRLILVGVLMAGVATSLTTILLLFANESQVAQILRWTLGSTNGRIWTHFWAVLPYALIGLTAAYCSAGAANVLQLGDETSKSLGQRVEYTRYWLLFIAAFLTAGAVSVVGAIGLIGLIGPHMARRFAGADARKLMPLSALLTGLLLLMADILARTVELSFLLGSANASGTGLPVGAVTAFLGVPFFLYLILKPRSPK